MKKRLSLIAAVGAAIASVFVVNYLVLAVFNEPAASPPDGNTAPPVINLFTQCSGGCLTDQVTGLRWDRNTRTDTDWTTANNACHEQGARLPTVGELVHRNTDSGHDLWTENLSFERAAKSGFFSRGSTDIIWGFIVRGKHVGVTHFDSGRFPYLCVNGL